ncbi:hypothetical protein [Chloroflexus sp.]|uniref:hypothetical protein n=1 Tax=Chloroflexus sp. TaxID=1904827 RepID=UPI002ACD9E2F|nr:hypothetical protein [Chloroflexus sp.]
MEQRRRGSGWIGWLVFLLFILGPSILPPLARWLTQQTGVPIGTTELFIALIVLMVVISVIFGALRQSSEGGGRPSMPEENDPFSIPSAQGEVFRLPSANPDEVFRMPPPPPEPPRMPASSTNLPGAPRFEPIIDPRILTIGIIGVVFIGLVFGVLFLLTNP